METPLASLNPSPTRRVQRIRHELRRRDVQVLRTEPLGPGFVAVTFGGESLEGFVSAGFDDHVKFILDGEGGEPVRRDYTPRRFDAQRRELTIEFALHGHGAASDWARRARPGDTATLGGPRGSMVVPTDYDWHLFAGDATALPAIHRRLEELPAHTRAIVLLQVPAVADRRTLGSAAALDLHWLATPDALLQTLQALPLPAGEGFAWAAGEAATMARVRDLLLHDKGHPKEAARISAYWRAGQSDFHEDL